MASIWVGIALKSGMILSAALLLAKALSGRSAAMRHLIWTASSVALLVLPVLSISLPAWKIAPTPSTLRATFAVSSLSRAASESRGVAQSFRNNPAARAQVQIPSLPNLLTLIWAAGAMAALIRMTLAYVSVRDLRRSSRRIVKEEYIRLAEELGIHERIDFFEAGRGSMPLACGVLRPFIVIPEDAACWTLERRRAVILHELAHVQRGDTATQLIAFTAYALYWWNPLVWMARREFLNERERAADDLVLASGARASEYASQLVAVASTMRAAPALAPAAVGMARASQLEQRVQAILNATTNRRPARRHTAAIAILAAILTTTPLAAVRAQEHPQQEVPADVDAFIKSTISQGSFERLEDAATAAEETRRFDIAERLLIAALDVRRQRFGDSSAEVGTGFLKLAYLAERRHDAKRAVKFYSKALELLGDRRESVAALIALGVDAIGTKDYTRATEYFERAKNVNPDGSGLALMWVAVVMQRQNNAEEAQKLYQQALAAEGGNGPDRSVVAHVYASFLRTQGREDEAKLVARTAPPEPPQTALPAGVYRIADGTTAPKVLNKVEPDYTDAAKAAGLEGTSIVSVEIWPDGRAHNPQVLRPLGLGLDEHGIDAISQWQFDPGTKDGQAVKVLATIEINFRLL